VPSRLVAKAEEKRQLGVALRFPSAARAEDIAQSQQSNISRGKSVVLARPMPITPFLKGEKFDAETTRAMGAALEMVCVALRTGDCADDVKQAIADKIIALAKAGERHPDALCEQVLKEIRTAPLSTMTVIKEGSPEPPLVGSRAGLSCLGLDPTS
jgi:hypothetical protein